MFGFFMCLYKMCLYFYTIMCLNVICNYITCVRWVLLRIIYGMYMYLCIICIYFTHSRDYLVFLYFRPCVLGYGNACSYFQWCYVVLYLLWPYLSKIIYSNMYGIYVTMYNLYRCWLFYRPCVLGYATVWSYFQWCYITLYIKINLQ